jgi:hypothetical protein
MYHSMKSGAVILMLAFVVSCSKKGHEPKPVCTFTGKTTLIENKGSLSLKSSSSTELDQDDPDFHHGSTDGWSKQPHQREIHKFQWRKQ